MVVFAFASKVLELLVFAGVVVFVVLGSAGVVIFVVVEPAGAGASVALLWAGATMGEGGGE